MWWLEPFVIRLSFFFFFFFLQICYARRCASKTPSVVCIVRISDGYLSRRKPVGGISRGGNGRPVQNGLLLSVSLTEEVPCLTKTLVKVKAKTSFPAFGDILILLEHGRLLQLQRNCGRCSVHVRFFLFLFSFFALESNSQLLLLAFVSPERMPVGTSRQGPFELF